MSARQFAKISIYIDRDEDWHKLPTDAQWLYTHLLHQPNLSTAGVLPVQVEKLAKGAADMTVDRVRAAANVLVERRFVVVDLDTVELLIRTFIRHDVAAQGHPRSCRARSTARCKPSHPSCAASSSARYGSSNGACPSTCFRSPISWRPASARILRKAFQRLSRANRKAALQLRSRVGLALNHLRTASAAEDTRPCNTGCAVPASAAS